MLVADNWIVSLPTTALGSAEVRPFGWARRRLRDGSSLLALYDALTRLQREESSHEGDRTHPPR